MDEAEIHALVAAGVTAEQLAAAFIAHLRKLAAADAATQAEHRRRAADRKAKQRARERAYAQAQADVTVTMPDVTVTSAAELTKHHKKHPQPPQDAQLCMVEWIEEQIVAGENASGTVTVTTPDVTVTTPPVTVTTPPVTVTTEPERVPPASLPSPSDGAPSPPPPMVPPLLHLTPSLPPTPHPLLTSHTPASTPSSSTPEFTMGRGRAQADEPRLEVVEAEEVFEDRPSENPKASSRTQQACGKPSPRRAVPCPDDFQPNAHHREIVASAGQSETFLLDQRDMMLDWSRSDGNTKKDWNATFNIWLRRAIADEKAQQRKYARPGNAMTYLVEKDRRLREERLAQERKTRTENMFSMLRTGGLHG